MSVRCAIQRYGENQIWKSAVFPAIQICINYKRFTSLTAKRRHKKFNSIFKAMRKSNRRGVDELEPGTLHA